MGGRNQDSIPRDKKPLAETMELPSRNMDQFRGSIDNLDIESIVRSLRWLRGERSFPYPTSIHLDLTLRCTARCLHCKQWTWPVHSEFAANQIDTLFSVFEAWGVRTLTFGGGNPLLSDQIERALLLANRAGMEVGIITEGVGLTDRMAEIIGEYARWVRFSLDGPDSYIHDSIRNAPGSFERVASDVAKLRSKAAGLRIGLNCVIQRLNIHHLSQMVSLSNRMQVDALLLKIPHGDDTERSFLPSLEDWRQARRWMEAVHLTELAEPTNIGDLLAIVRLLSEEDMAIGRPVRSFYEKRNIRCFVPFFFMTCDSQGNTYPCDYLQADTRLWTGEYGEMRKRFCCGNVLNDERGVLRNLSRIVEEVQRLPATQYDECGCCTRFFQLNAALTAIDNSLGKHFSHQQVKDFVKLMAQRKVQEAFL